LFFTVSPPLQVVAVLYVHKAAPVQFGSEKM
jgi:hypothetical protein